MSEDQKPNPEKLPKNTLADSIQKNDKEFDKKMRQYDNEIEEIKNNILKEKR